MNYLNIGTEASQGLDRISVFLKSLERMKDTNNDQRN